MLFLNFSRFRTIIILSLLLSSAFLFGCSYYVGNISDITPKPRDVAVQKPPTINQCDAEFNRTKKEEVTEEEWQCDWVCNPWICGCDDDDCCCMWCRWVTVVVGHDVCGDIRLTLQVNDPSDDLNIDKSPILRIFDSTSVSGPDTCHLDISGKDIALTHADITGSGTNKTVSITLENKCMRFNDECSTFASEIPMSLVFEDCGKYMYSRNRCKARIKVTDP